MAEEADLHVPTLWETAVAWLGAPRRYQVTRWLILRLLGVVYVFAFAGLIFQGPGLLGSHGLTPVGAYVDRLHAAGASVLQVPSLFLWGASDGALAIWAWIGFAIAVAVAAGYANLPMLLALWLIYGSYERVGQLWFGFGWEIQLLETTLLAAFLAHPWDPRPLRARPPPTAAIVLMRWLVFRIMLGAGLIKLRGDACWADLTCLDAHFETQPIPNPLSTWFHHLPHAVHAAGVMLNHVVEVGLPWFVFGPRRLRIIAGCAMAGFQIILILSGNLAFLNWLTLIPILAVFDDDFYLWFVPRRARAWIDGRIGSPQPRDARQMWWTLVVALPVFRLAALALGGFSDGTALAVGAALAACAAAAIAIRGPVQRAIVRTIVSAGKRLDGHQVAVGCFAAVVIIKSWPVVDNLTSHRQAMNTSYDRLEIVNTYGAFGSVDLVRHELVIEGTLDPDPQTATWHAYELPCKPGDVTRRPCVLGPYHRRLDWLIWFSAMEDEPRDPWIIHLVWKLLVGDRTIRELIAVDPFDGRRPRWVRIRRFVYHLAPYDAPTWWVRDDEQPWLQPIELTTPGFKEALAEYGWPSPSD